MCHRAQGCRGNRILQIRSHICSSCGYGAEIVDVERPARQFSFAVGGDLPGNVFSFSRSAGGVRPAELEGIAASQGSIYERPALCVIQEAVSDNPGSGFLEDGARRRNGVKNVRMTAD